MKKLKRYAAWARKIGSDNEFITTVFYAQNITEAKKMFSEYEIQGKIYLSKVS